MKTFEEPVARVKELLGREIRAGRVTFVLCNVVQMPRPPKGRRNRR